MNEKQEEGNHQTVMGLLERLTRLSVNGGTISPDDMQRLRAGVIDLWCTAWALQGRLAGEVRLAKCRNEDIAELERRVEELTKMQTGAKS